MLTVKKVPITLRPMSFIYLYRCKQPLFPQPFIRLMFRQHAADNTGDSCSDIELGTSAKSLRGQIYSAATA